MIVFLIEAMIFYFACVNLSQFAWFLTILRSKKLNEITKRYL